MNLQWTHQFTVLRNLAKAVREQNGSPLSFSHKSALFGRLQSGPVFILGSATTYARHMLQAAQQVLRVAAVVDDFTDAESISGVPRVTTEEFIRSAHGSRAICCTFSRNGRIHFESAATLAGAEIVHYMQAADCIPAFAHTHILAKLADETAARIEELLSIARDLADDLSIQTLVSVLMGRLTYSREYLESVSVGENCMYFGLPIFPLGPAETLVDCGAFDGDTIEKAKSATADSFAKIIALEPEPANFATLQTRYGQDQRIQLVPCGAAEAQKTAFFHGGMGEMSYASADAASNGMAITMTTLDSLLSHTKPTLLKMDIEGGEAAALAGAEETIRTHRPKLAISVYHRPADLIELPRQICKYADGYRFYLRHHRDFFHDTVLYGVPEAA